MHFCWCHFDYIHIYIQLQSVHASVSRIAYGYVSRHNAKKHHYIKESPKSKQVGTVSY